MIPKSCGFVENKMALEDLRTAHLQDPEDEFLKQEYLRLYNELKRQREKDVARFDGFLSKGHIVDQEEEEKDLINTYNKSRRQMQTSQVDKIEINSSDSEQAPEFVAGTKDDVRKTAADTDEEENTWTVSDALAKLKDVESAALRLQQEGRYIEADILMQRVDSVTAMVNQYCEEKKRERQRLEDDMQRESLEDKLKRDAQNQGVELTADRYKVLRYILLQYLFMWSNPSPHGTD